jgi:hypothetical protein
MSFGDHWKWRTLIIFLLLAAGLALSIWQSTSNPVLSPSVVFSEASNASERPSFDFTFAEYSSERLPTASLNQSEWINLLCVVGITWRSIVVAYMYSTKHKGDVLYSVQYIVGLYRYMFIRSHEGTLQGSSA